MTPERIDRDDARCRLCDAEGPLEAHHWSYPDDHPYPERVEHLDDPVRIALCPACHAAVHGCEGRTALDQKRGSPTDSYLAPALARLVELHAERHDHAPEEGFADRYDVPVPEARIARAVVLDATDVLGVADEACSVDGCSRGRLVVEGRMHDRCLHHVGAEGEAGTWDTVEGAEGVDGANALALSDLSSRTAVLEAALDPWPRSISETEFVALARRLEGRSTSAGVRAVWTATRSAGEVTPAALRDALAPP